MTWLWWDLKNVKHSFASPFARQRASFDLSPIIFDFIFAQMIKSCFCASKNVRPFRRDRAIIIGRNIAFGPWYSMMSDQDCPIASPEI